MRPADDSSFGWPKKKSNVPRIRNGKLERPHASGDHFHFRARYTTDKVQQKTRNLRTANIEDI
jgi:hypothetical protein